MTRKELENERLQRTTLHERGYWERGLALAGMDEAGRGPLAGPVVAACAVMPSEPLIAYVKDSKQLSEKRREAVFEEIVKTAVAFGVGIVGPEEIDSLNILVATRRAFCAAYASMGFTPDAVLTDAMDGLGLPVPTRSFIKGDQLSYSVAAASIIAKVTRDRLMRELDAKYPHYGFAKHKGYGTAAHYAAINEHGACPEHRKTFLKNMGTKHAKGGTCVSGDLDTRLPSIRIKNREKGERGETLACEYLSACGFDIIERNFRANGGEIDIIARQGDLVVFVEVKARTSEQYGAGREHVTQTKQAHMAKAASAYMQNNKRFTTTRFDIIEVDLIYESTKHIESAFTT